MNHHSWSCAVCGIPNSSALTECRNCKTPRTLTTEKLLEKNAAVESRAIFVFQAVFLLLAVIFAIAITSSFFVGVAVVIGIWWAGLACFASLPVGGEFRHERQFVSRLLNEQTSIARRHAVQWLFYGLYWPIFISKNAYFIFIIGAGVIYYGAKYLHGQ
jgi:predicted anti-sigma-YlaC factor YlaD